MSRKELVNLFEKNVLLFAKLSERINRDFIDFGEYSKVQVQLLVHLYFAGRVRLKDLAAREFMSAPNLCAVLKKMESKGLVQREEDTQDHRNMWYCVTEFGKHTAMHFTEMLHRAIDTVFKDINKNDEAELIGALKTIHNIFMNMEAQHA